MSEQSPPREVDEWLQDSLADVERRGMPELKPLLEALAPSTRLLRAADWNDSPDAGVDR
jgi:hypothetical protein